jgi:hypothetical protein
VEPGGIFYLSSGPWQPEQVELKGTINAPMPIYPMLAEDGFGRQFLVELEQFIGSPRLVTDAPWFVRVRAWRPETVDALVVHWINYLQDEEAAIEIPIPIEPVQVTCQIPDGVQVERIEWQYPEMREPVALEYEASGANVRFAIPRLIAYGMSVLHLRDE